MSEEKQYSRIVNEIKSELKTNTLIADKYGIILGSEIKGLEKGRIIPTEILDLITQRQRIAKSLNLKDIQTVSLESTEFYFLITTNEDLILIAQMDKNIDFSKFIPSLKAFLTKLVYDNAKVIDIDFSEFDFSKEIKRLEESLVQDEDKKLKFNIIKELINYIS